MIQLPQTTILQLPPSLPKPRLVSRLDTRIGLKSYAAQAESIEFFDSFDWDLWFTGLTLQRTQDRLAIFARDELLVGGAESALDWAAPVPRFWWELPDSRIRRIIRSQLKLRALLPVLRIDAQVQRFDVKNSDAKTVATLNIKTFSCPLDEHPSTWELCWVRALRGYSRETNALIGDLHDLGLHSAEPDALGRMLGEAAGVPDRYPGGVQLELAPGQSSREAVLHMTGRMLAFARSREAGVRDDIDTEFLHAYRVSIRKIRSVLGQLKGALPLTETEDLKRSLGALARRTNRLRDLDVYLLAREQYLHLVPASLQPGLETMFRDFERERSREYGAVRRYLRSKSHARLMERLERITGGRRRMPDSGNAAVAVGELAARHIRKRHAKIAHAGAGIDRQTPDQELHDLRIECKKLRYLLELFESLFARQDVTAAVARLKRLQDALGTFNDLCVQQAELGGYLQTQQHGEAPDAALAASIGGLLGALHQQRQNQREQVIAEVNEFCTGRVGLLFERLYQQYEKRRK